MRIYDAQRIRRITKLIFKLRKMVASLDRSRDLGIHSRLDQFYYMTKVEELKILLDQCEVEKNQLDSTVSRMDVKYAEVFNRWRHDARLLNSHMMKESSKN